MTSERKRALVVDDEPIARSALRELLTEVPWIEWVGEATDGADALSAIRRLSPDLVFLDIQMPGMTGLELLERADRTFAVIFTTAYDEHALAAFELGAIDYLRKPFGRERFLRALERARPHLMWPVDEHERHADGGRDADAAPIEERLASGRSRILTRLFVRDRGSIIPVQVAEVVRFEADGDYVAVVLPNRRYLVYLNLTDLAARLDPDTFVRIHRSHVVNLDRVAAMAPYDANRLEVRMQDGSSLVASRSGTALLRLRFTLMP